MKNNKGFTLAELLIVVAIIAVLTMVAVPIFNTQLEKSREETDIANMRAAKAAAVAYFLDHPEATQVNFNATTGAVQTDTPAGYGKGTGTNGGADYPGYYAAQAYTNEYVIVTRANTGNVETLTVSWSGTHNPPTT